jgi:nicotinamide-nucleotide adenylyltransferase
MYKYGKIGVIGRFKPLHNYTASLLEKLCRESEEVIIGIGSSNKYNRFNPFTAKETKGMIDVFLSKKYNNYKIVCIPDSGHIAKYRNGEKWKKDILKKFGNLDFFVTGNEYVKTLLEKNYKIVDSYELLGIKKNGFHSTDVRIEIAKNGDLKKFVPKEVADYLEKKKLIERFRKEFGKETLENIRDASLNDESLEEEMKKVSSI